MTPFPHPAHRSSPPKGPERNRERRKKGGEWEEMREVGTPSIVFWGGGGGFWLSLFGGGWRIRGERGLIFLDSSPRLLSQGSLLQKGERGKRKKEKGGKGKEQELFPAPYRRRLHQRRGEGGKKREERGGGGKKESRFSTTLSPLRRYRSKGGKKGRREGRKRRSTSAGILRLSPAGLSSRKKGKGKKREEKKGGRKKRRKSCYLLPYYNITSLPFIHQESTLERNRRG